jgi:hypothetical protein
MLFCAKSVLACAGIRSGAAALQSQITAPSALSAARHSVRAMGHGSHSRCGDATAIRCLASRHNMCCVSPSLLLAVDHPYVAFAVCAANPTSMMRIDFIWIPPFHLQRQQVMISRARPRCRVDRRSCCDAPQRTARAALLPSLPHAAARARRRATVVALHTTMSMLFAPASRSPHRNLTPLGLSLHSPETLSKEKQRNLQGESAAPVEWRCVPRFTALPAPSDTSA